MPFPNPDDYPRDQDLLLAFVDAWEDMVGAVISPRSGRGIQAPQPAPSVLSNLGEEGRRQIRRDFDELRGALEDASPGKLLAHGLVGPQLRFKLAHIHWRQVPALQDGTLMLFGIRGKTVGDLVNTVGDSILDATGVGTGLREIGDIATDVIQGEIDG
jgi:hypothetical protein